MDINAGFGMASGDIHLITKDNHLDAEDFVTIKKNIEEFRDDAEVQIFLLGTVIESIEADSNENSAGADISNQWFPILRGGNSIGYGFYY
jgi:hypothetical protein